MEHRTKKNYLIEVLAGLALVLLLSWAGANVLVSNQVEATHQETANARRDIASQGRRMERMRLQLLDSLAAGLLQLARDTAGRVAVVRVNAPEVFVAAARIVLPDSLLDGIAITNQKIEALSHRVGELSVRLVAVQRGQERVRDSTAVGELRALRTDFERMKVALTPKETLKTGKRRKKGY